MSDREALSAGSRLGMAATGGLVLACVAFFFFRMAGSSVSTSASKAFFTVDDGKSWFTDDASKFPPFDKDGRQAVRAFVYRCADGTVFVNNLERFRPEVKTALEEASRPDPNRKGPPDQTVFRDAFASGRELKRPGDAKWVKSNDFRAAAQILAIKCPDGNTDAVPVDP